MLGEKLKEARKKLGLSQEQLAEKLSVSRQAISKWESNRGIPDVENLKNISKLLEVSIDYLLKEEELDDKVEFFIKEEINIEDYKKEGNARSKYDSIVKIKYSNADKIYPLIRRKKLSKLEWVIDLIVQPGVLELADAFNDMASYYLVEVKSIQLLVKVNKEFIESKELLDRFDGKKKVIGGNLFVKGTYQLV